MQKLLHFVNNRILLFLLSFLLLAFANAELTAQTVTGTVLDENGQELPGVNVIVTGTTIGTITSINGSFSIDVPEANSSLTLSFIGYKNAVIPLDGRTNITVSLELDAQVLDDVVVIGYGTIRKEDLTGSVGVVTAEDLNRTPVTNIGKALQGKASGVVVMQSGDPGGSYNIRVRGIGSITQDPDPLVVIDGVMGGSMNSISPSDIESISVLKDASASAIYGANGANGVIMITTKKGSRDRLNVSFSAYTGMNFRPRKFDLMDADQYADFYKNVSEQNSLPQQFAYTDEFREFYYGNGWEKGTDWQDEILQKSTTNNVSLRISNGSETGRYSLSANVADETGILLSTNSRRYNFRLNSDFNLGKYIKLGESFSYTRSKWREGSGSAWGMSLQSSPLMKVYNPDNKEGFEGSQIGVLWDPNGDGIGIDLDGDGKGDIIPNTGRNDKFNPKAILAIPHDVNYSDAILANVNIEITPFPWLTYSMIPSIRAYINETDDWTPSYDLGVRSVGSASLDESYSKGNTYSIENKLSFDKDFGYHSINAIAVYQVIKSDGASLTVNATGFPFEYLNVISQSDPVGRIASGSRNPHGSGSISYLGRIIYDYKSKYLFTASLRRDGTSNFLPGKRWGNFPSFSFAWKLNEDFLTNVEQINMLKIRAGWGMTGNSSIGGFRFQTNLAEFTHFSPVFGLSQTEALALNELWNIGNPLIKWESANMTNFGIDLYAFRNKIQMSAEYYIKNQFDLLASVPVSAAMGKWNDVGAVYNIADVVNRGFEYDVKYSKMDGNFNYKLYGNLATVKNEVISIPDSYIDDNNITIEGHTIGSIYGYIAEGIIQESDFNDDGSYLHAIPSDGVPSPGDLRYRDLNKDGKITDLDRTIIGKAVPDMTYSFGFDLYYGNFDFSVFMYGISKAQIFNTLRRDIESFSSQDLDHNKSAVWAENYFRDDNPSTEYLRLDPTNSNLNTRISTWWVEDASFLRVKDIQLGYTLKNDITNRIGISRARIYLSGANIFTFTKYSGYDPESPLNSNDVLVPGVDSNKYPLPKTFTGGIQIDF